MRVPDGLSDNEEPSGFTSRRRTVVSASSPVAKQRSLSRLIIYKLALGHVAQLVEHQTENLGVAGANPVVSIQPPNALVGSTSFLIRKTVRFDSGAPAAWACLVPENPLAYFWSVVFFNLSR